MNKYLIYLKRPGSCCYLFKVEPEKLKDYNFKGLKYITGSKLRLYNLDLYKIVSITSKITGERVEKERIIKSEKPTQEDLSNYIGQIILHPSDENIDVLAENDEDAIREFNRIFNNSSSLMDSLLLFIDSDFRRWNLVQCNNKKHPSDNISIYNGDLRDMTIEDYINKSFSPKKNYFMLDSSWDTTLNTVGTKLLLSLCASGDLGMKKLVKYLDTINKIHPFSTVVIYLETDWNTIIPDTYGVDLRTGSADNIQGQLLFNGEEDFIFNPKVIFYYRFYENQLGNVRLFMNLNADIKALKFETSDDYELPDWLQPFDVNGVQK